MSKRTQSIRSMFAGQSAASDASDARRPVLPRVNSGAVRSLKETFSDVEKDYEALRAELTSGLVAIELDPLSIDPSPLPDRFVEQDAVSFETLKASIKERGQEIPVLVREHPTAAGRYQSAYGHRRIRAARELGVKVKAFVRNLSDEDLILAQGVENSARDDLSFIERAVFALRLEDAGYKRSLIQTSLSVDRAEVSKLIAVARSLPTQLIEAIGRAPKVGRPRWQNLVDALGDEAALARALEAASSPRFKVSSTDDRFAAALAAARKSPAPSPIKRAASVVTHGSGTEIGRIAKTDREWRLCIARDRHEGFADYLALKLPELFEAYEAARNGE